MLYWLLGDLWDKFTASLLPDPLLKCLLSSQTHLHGDSGKKLLVWKSKFLHKWLPMETGFVPKPDNREEDQALITQLDLGLQRQQPHSVQSCTGWGTIAKEVFTSVYISSLVKWACFPLVTPTSKYMISPGDADTDIMNIFYCFSIPSRLNYIRWIQFSSLLLLYFSFFQSSDSQHFITSLSSNILKSIIVKVCLDQVPWFFNALICGGTQPLKSLNVTIPTHPKGG